MSEVSLQAINLPGPGVRTQYQEAAARLFLEERTARIRRRLCFLIFVFSPNVITLPFAVESVGNIIRGKGAVREQRRPLLAATVTRFEGFEVLLRFLSLGARKQSYIHTIHSL